MKSVMMEEAEQQECRYRTIDFEETELRLGLPLSGSEGLKINNAFSGGKRGFSDANSSSSSSSVDLKLNLVPSGSSSSTSLAKENTAAPARSNDPAKPPAKAQVVGWPPVRSSRKNIVVNIQSRINNEADQEKATTSSTPAAATTSTGSAAAFVKVSMDGAPYLRKVDLKLYNTYQELWDALAKMFSSFTVPKCGSSQGVMKEFSFNMNESKLIDLLNGSDYVPTYEDKDGYWMLVGDVPWQMFVESCKRLRIMKGSEAIGLAPKAVEKCKNRIS